MIDIHCHILPGIDDGPSNFADSILMANQAIADGIHTIVATPHTHNDIYFNPPNRVVEEVDRFQTILLEKHLRLEICPGSDVHVCSGLTEKVLSRQVSTINNTMRYLLVEFPFQAIPEGIENELFRLRLNGITPIITHPERNLIFQYNLDSLRDLIAIGCLVQVTAVSITGGFGSEAMESVHQMLELRMAHIIATDAHSPDNRPPVLSEAVEVASMVLGNEGEAMAMVTERPNAIINGEAVDVPKPATMRRRWWQLGRGE